MIALYIILIFLLILSFYVIIHKKWGISLYLIAVYLLSVTTSIFDAENIEIIDYISPFSGLVFCILFFFIFKPFIKTEPSILGFENQKQCNAFVKIGTILSLILIFGMLLQITLISDAFCYGLANVRDDMYNEYSSQKKMSFFESIGSGIVGYLKGTSFTLVLMFFYALCFIKGHSKLKFLLIIASLSGAYSGILLGGRTQTMYWMMYVIFAFILFRNNIPKKEKRILYIVLGSLFCIMVAYFIFMSILRVALSDSSASEFILEYTSQIIPNFCNYVDNFNMTDFTLARIFPNIDYYINGTFDTIAHNDKNYMATGIIAFNFTTFVGDLMEDIGWGVILYIACFFYIAKHCTRKKVYSVSDLIYLGLIYQIPLHGLFYNSLGNRWATLGIVFSILIAKYLTSKITVEKKNVQNEC